MKREVLYKRGNVVCDDLEIKDDHKFIFRVFVNLTYYGKILGILAFYYARHFNF